jgi:multidrug efflux pump subunit AcrB
MNFISNANASPYSAGFIKLKDYDKRGEMKDPDQIAAGLTGKVSQVKDANAFFFNFPTVQGFGNVSGFEFMLQDKTNGSFEQLGTTTQQFIGELMKRPEIAFAFTTYAAGNPQYTIDVDTDKANQLGVSITELMQTMQIYYGSSFVSDFNRFGKYYRVMAQADIPYRTDANSLEGIYVKNKSGEMVPAKTLVTLKRTFGPETVTRNNLFNAVTINGTPKPGYSTGDAIKAVEEVAKQSLPRGYGYEWTGITREEIKTSGQTALSSFEYFVCVFLLAQYESYILPFAVILNHSYRDIRSICLHRTGWN